MNDTINFLCPGCGHDLVVKSPVKIKSTDDIEGTTCQNCGSVVHKDDIIRQLRNHAEKLIRDTLGKHFKKK